MPPEPTTEDRYGFEFFRCTMYPHDVLWVELNRPERRNAIDAGMHAELTPLFRRIAEDRQVAVVVLTGAGDKAFCVGADFGGMQENLDHGYEDGYPELMIGSAEVVRAQLAIPQPVLAAVNGDAMGLGATMALFCDLVFMAESARIADPHVKAGLVAGDGGAILWPMLLGLHRGKEFLFTGDVMTARQAADLGLVNHLCRPDELRRATTEMAERLAQGPRHAIQFNKRLANAEVLQRVTRLIDASLAMEAITFGTADHREAVRSFLERRPPSFGGSG
jgi:enoyl-CoA hydratase